MIVFGREMTEEWMWFVEKTLMNECGLCRLVEECMWFEGKSWRMIVIYREAIDDWLCFVGRRLKNDCVLWWRDSFIKIYQTIQKRCRINDRILFVNLCTGLCLIRISFIHFCLFVGAWNTQPLGLWTASSWTLLLTLWSINFVEFLPPSFHRGPTSLSSCQHWGRWHSCYLPFVVSEI